VSVNAAFTGTSAAPLPDRAHDGPDLLELSAGLAAGYLITGQGSHRATSGLCSLMFIYLTVGMSALKTFPVPISHCLSTWRASYSQSAVALRQQVLRCQSWQIAGQRYQLHPKSSILTVAVPAMPQLRVAAIAAESYIISSGARAASNNANHWRKFAGRDSRCESEAACALTWLYTVSTSCSANAVAMACFMLDIQLILHCVDDYAITIELCAGRVTCAVASLYQMSACDCTAIHLRALWM
jgi:hypothetical protein